jgi:hypothetical protein
MLISSSSTSLKSEKCSISAHVNPLKSQMKIPNMNFTPTPLKNIEDSQESPKSEAFQVMKPLRS